MKYGWLSRYKYWVLAAVTIVTAGALISVFSSYWLCQHILKFFGDWSVALSAGATVILAVAAFKSIKETRRIREEDRELNFKLRLLDEVRDWAREAVKLGFLYERARNKAEVRQVFEDMIEEVAKTADIAITAAEIFENELEVPAIKALGFVKSYEDPSKFATKEYFDSLFELLKATNKAKRKLLEL